MNESIRRGLAANIKAAIPNGVFVFPYYREEPQVPALMVSGLVGIDYIENTAMADPGGTSLVIVEGVAGRVSDIGAQKVFDGWLLDGGDSCVRDALESDYHLTSRMRDDGSIETGATAACDSLAVREFRGTRRAQIGATLHLVGEWIVQVETSG